MRHDGRHERMVRWRVVTPFSLRERLGSNPLPPKARKERGSLTTDGFQKPVKSTGSCSAWVWKKHSMLPAWRDGCDTRRPNHGDFKTRDHVAQHGRGNRPRACRLAVRIRPWSPFISARGAIGRRSTFRPCRSGFESPRADQRTGTRSPRADQLGGGYAVPATFEGASQAAVTLRSQETRRGGTGSRSRLKSG
jgi:hypothetical protein